MLRRYLFAITAVSGAMLIIMLTVTNPANAGPLGILGFFVFMYITVLGVLTFLFKSIAAAMLRFAPEGKRRLLGGEISFKHSYYYASVLASVPVMFIALHSVGEVGIYQVLLVVFFIVVAWIYVNNRTR